MSWGEENKSLLLREELREGLCLGVTLTYNGDEIKEQELDTVVILMEECDYMREYVADHEGNIIQINYEQLK